MPWHSNHIPLPRLVVEEKSPCCGGNDNFPHILYMKDKSLYTIQSRGTSQGFIREFETERKIVIFSYSEPPKVLNNLGIFMLVNHHKILTCIMKNTLINTI